jgi:hypothetical protein
MKGQPLLKLACTYLYSASAATKSCFSSLLQPDKRISNKNCDIYSVVLPEKQTVVAQIIRVSRVRIHCFLVEFLGFFEVVVNTVQE